MLPLGVDTLRDIETDGVGGIGDGGSGTTCGETCRNVSTHDKSY